MAAQGSYGISIKATDDASKIIDQINRKLQQLRKPVESVEKQFKKFSDQGIGQVTKGFDSLISGMDRSVMSAMRLMPVLGGLFGAGLLAGLETMIAGTARLGLNLQMMSKNIGIPATTLREFERAGVMAGTTAERVDGLLEKLQEYRVALATGHADAGIAQVFQQLQIDTSKSASDILEQIAAKWSKMTNDQKTLFRDAFGISPDMRNFMDDFKKYIDQVKQNGELTDAQWKQIADEEKAILQLEDRLTEIKDQITAFTAPMVITWIDKETSELKILIDMYDKLHKAFEWWFQDRTPEQQKNLAKLGDSIFTAFTHALDPVQRIVDDIKLLTDMHLPDWMLHLLGVQTGQPGDTGSSSAPFVGPQGTPGQPRSHSANISPFDLGVGTSGSLTPNERALAEFVSGEEGTNGDYTRRQGPEGPGAHLDTDRPHPGTVAPGGSSTASGLYQFTRDTWEDMMREMRMPLDSPMTKENQDKAFQQMLRHLGITSEMLADPSQREEVIRRLATRWDSMPGAGHPNHDMSDAKAILDQYNRRERDRTAGLLPPMPMSAPAVSGNITVNLHHATAPPPGFGASVSTSGEAFGNLPAWQLP